MAVNVSIPRKHRSHPTLLAIRLGLGDVGQSRIEFAQPGVEVIDREQVVRDDVALGLVLPAQTVHPLLVSAGPVAPGVVQTSP